MKLSDYVFDFVARLGVKHVFMLPGGGAMHLVDSVGRNPQIEFVADLHEQAAAIAAEAHAQISGNLGVVLVTTGPGGTNAITGVAGAWLESTPILVISGQVKRADLRSSLDGGKHVLPRQVGVQELDIVSIVKTITKYAVMVTDPTTIRHHLERAVVRARSGRPGPVWIDIPLDVQAAEIDPAALPGYRMDGTDETDRITGTELAGVVEQTVQLLRAARRPVILAGAGIRTAGAVQEFRELVDRLGVPVLTTWKAADMLSEGHPFFAGKPGTVAARGANFVLQNSDCLIAIGARLDFAVTGFDQQQFAPQARKVVVDVDPGEIAKLKMTIEVPIVADAGEFVRALLSANGRVPGAGREGWLARCRAWRERYPVMLPEYRQAGESINPYVLADVLSDETGEDDLIVPGSSGSGIDMFWLAFRIKQGQRAICTGGLGAMGFGVPAAIGACLAAGRRRTITPDGDGGFQLNSQELETVARLRLPIKYFVLNNQGYASIRSMQQGHFKGHLVASDATSGLTLPDTVKLAAAYGIEAMRISDPHSLRAQIREALARPGPVVCDVLIDPRVPVAPRVTSQVTADGSMVSRPLEDLWPLLSRDELRANMIDRQTSVQ